jgi:uncharacterized protein (TIGR02145 family)
MIKILLAMKKKNTINFIALFALVVAIATGCRKNNPDQPTPQTTAGVSIHGKEYATLAINNLVWTAENYAGPGGIQFSPTENKPMYGKYYTYAEAQAITVPDGWRIPSRQDFIGMAQAVGIVFVNNRATHQEVIKSLVSTTHWRTIPGTNASGFNAYPAGYGFQDLLPRDGDIAEFWTIEGNSMSIQEGADGKTHRISFYDNSASPDYRFNIRFVRNK